MNVHALIFDFDGLIVDTETSEFQSWSEVYADHGCDLTLETWAQCIGRPHGYFDAYAHLEQLLGRPIDRDTIRARRRSRHRTRVESQPARPGVERYLTDARRHGMRVGLASSSTRAWVTGHLERLDLLEHFDQLVCCEDVDVHKPEPAPYLRCLELLDCGAGAAVAFEDSPNGVVAATRAGLFCVAVPNPVTAQLDLGAADLRVESLAELPLQELIAKAAVAGTRVRKDQ